MKARHSFLLAVLIGLVMIASGAARAELYKWTDDEGNVIYSQVPPPDRAVTTIAPPPPPPENPAAAKKDEAEGEDAADKSYQEENDKANKEIARIAKQNCEVAKRNLEIYTTFTRIRNEKGEITVLDDKTRAAKVKEAENSVKSFCK